MIMEIDIPKTSMECHLEILCVQKETEGEDIIFTSICILHEYT